MTAAQHAYTSTACTHELHEQCRGTCKFCAGPCRCACHHDQVFIDRHAHDVVDAKRARQATLPLGG